MTFPPINVNNFSSCYSCVTFYCKLFTKISDGWYYELPCGQPPLLLWRLEVLQSGRGGWEGDAPEQQHLQTESRPKADEESVVAGLGEALDNVHEFM